ncbi:hypothetical protein BH23CHL4_BH23CHL4_13010 [soil metagenome]
MAGTVRASEDHSEIAGALKPGTGGSAGLGPHELLEAALASCMIISARKELAEQGLDDTGVGVAVGRDRAAYIDVDDTRQIIVAERGRNRSENSSHGVREGPGQAPA